MTPLTKLMMFFIIVTVIVSCSSKSENSRTRVSSLNETYSNLSDLEAEVMFGRDLAARILGNYKAATDPKLIRYVNLVGRGLAQYSGRPELNFYFIVLKSKDINAYATPGGYIFITTGALNRMENEAQLACVLSHEIAHVTQRHVVKKLNIKGEDRSTFSAVSGTIGGSTATVRTLIEKSLDEATTILLKRGYELKEEMESDQVGIQMAALAGYDPTQLDRFLRLCKGFEVPDASYKGKHPQLSVRLASIRKALKETGLEKNTHAKLRRRFYANVKK